MRGCFGLLTDEIEKNMKQLINVMEYNGEIAIIPSQDTTGGDLLKIACVCIDMVSQMYGENYKQFVNEFYRNALLREDCYEEINWFEKYI